MVLWERNNIKTNRADSNVDFFIMPISLREVHRYLCYEFFLIEAAIAVDKATDANQQSTIYMRVKSWREKRQKWRK